MRKLAVLAALFLCIAGPAAAQDHPEDITNFQSDIVVARNGVLTVTETISVYATGDQINHGIYRDVPTTYTDKFGRREKVRFEVVGVTRDGHDEPYDTEGLDNGERVKIGDPDVIVDTGPHTYTVTYITDRQIGFFANYDELYWNVTGNGWIFPIEHASAVIHLPDRAWITQSAFYTGPQGADGKDAQSTVLNRNTIRFETTAPLGPEEGLTVAVGFSKGAVSPPSKEELRAEFIRDNADAIAAVLGILVLFIFYSVAWWEYGRDPRRGTIIPLFAPPAGLSPEAVRYIWKMSYDRKSFAAALINMAVKGYLKIREAKGTYTLERTGKGDSDADLTPTERRLAQRLFDDGDKIVLTQDNHSTIASAISTLKTSLQAECEQHYFVTNRSWFFGGLAILAVTGIAAALLSENPEAAIFILVWAGGMSAGVSFLVHQAVRSWIGVFAGPGARIQNFFTAVFMTLFALPFAGAVAVALFFFGRGISFPTLAALIVGGVLAYVFHHLLKAPTAAGAPVYDQIEGFRLFLDTAEKDRLEVLNPPNVTPELFEKFLPYAIALDCENRWSKKFEAEAAAAANAPGGSGAAYVPIWYSGSSFNNLGTASFVSSLGSSIGNAVAASSTAPGSSSGSGGGGFSGGGGGGGGGGGW
jgi:uncharacterized membrane protein YgcG